MTFVLSLLFVFVSGCCLLLLKWGVDARPEALSATARGIDAQFLWTLVLTGIAFLAVHVLLLRVVLRRSSPRAATSLQAIRRVERTALVGVSLVFLFLAVRGQGVWARMFRADVDNAPVRIEIVASQFVWDVRYAGADIALQNEVIVPVGQTVVLAMQARDVIHSFFVPALRIKQDVVPGLVTHLAFTAERPGQYEIACAELCGLGHYRMRGTLRVVPLDDYTRWLVQQAPGGER